MSQVVCLNVCKWSFTDSGGELVVKENSYMEPVTKKRIIEEMERSNKFSYD